MLDAGTTLAAAEALKHRRGRTWTDEQVAYLIELAYRTGLAKGRAYDTAELLATWSEKHVDPPTREDRIAAEMASYGPVKYHGGPVDWETGRPLRGAACPA